MLVELFDHLILQNKVIVMMMFDILFVTGMYWCVVCRVEALLICFYFLAGIISQNIHL